MIDPTLRMAFIGGGNMASAIIGGLIRQHLPLAQIQVVEPFAPAREALHEKFGLTAHEHAGDFLNQATMVVWAVKPQSFREAAAPVRPHLAVSLPLHLSVAAGIPSLSIANWLGSERVVRSMPNTPALIGQGITGLYARAGVSEQDKHRVEQVVATTGDHLWLEHEAQLDAVTALSGSGPAYVFYFLEAMSSAGVKMGLSEAQAYKLALQTFIGASALAQSSSDSPAVLRERVTSKGGTTHAAITSMDESGVKALFGRALHAAERRARELGEEFGKA